MLHTSNPRLITIGETMMLVTPARAESLATADDVRLHPGGAESNGACHMAHLGVPSACVSAAAVTSSSAWRVSSPRA